MILFLRVRCNSILKISLNPSGVHLYIRWVVPKHLSSVSIGGYNPDTQPIGFYQYTQVLCYWSLELIFKAKLMSKSGNQGPQYGRQAAVLNVTSLKICLWPHSTYTWNLKLKFRSKFYVCPGNHVVYRRTDRRTRWFHYTPPPLTSLGGV